MPIAGRLFVCEEVDCGFSSEKGPEVVTHAVHTQHRVSSPPDEEGLSVTISAEPAEEES